MTGRNRARRVPYRLAALAAAGALAVGFVACGDDDSGGSGASGGGDGGEERVTVGLITKTETNPFFVKMKEAAQKAAQENNVDLITASGKFDTDNASQVTALENMTTQGAKGILIVPSDSKAIVPAIEKARDAGVTVIALDTPPEPQDAVDALYRHGQHEGRRADRSVRQGQGRGARPGARRSPCWTSRRASRSASCGTTASSRASGSRRATRRSSAPPTRSERPPRARPAMETLLQKDPGHQRRLLDQRAVGLRRRQRAEGRRQGPEGLHPRLRRRRLRRDQRGVKPGIIDATSQQYPQNMASQGVETIAKAARGGEKPSGYVDTGVNADHRRPGRGRRPRRTSPSARRTAGARARARGVGRRRTTCGRLPPRHRPCALTEGTIS